MTAQILLVEDNPITRKMVRFALEAKEFAVHEAPDGQSAIARLSEPGIDLVLQDLLLPDMDGFELVGRLRALQAGADIPILAFSGFLSKLDEARISSAGFTDMISKPIEPSRMLQIIRAHLPSREVSPGTPGRGKRLVVADDDAVQRKLACFRLGRLGFETFGAANGEEALELARRLIPDAVVSDVMMPRMDGFGLCMALRREASLSAVPIVLMTNSYVEEADRAFAQKAGASAFVLRTPELKEVVEALRSSLQAPVPPPPQAGEPTSIERERASRVLHQLERQVALNAGIAQRCATLSAELSLLSGISEALVRQKDIDAVLNETLAACFDAGGISSGVLYLVEGQGLQLHQFGRHEWSDAEAQAFFGAPELLQRVLSGRRTVAVPSADLPPEAVRAFLAKSRASSALVVPIVSQKASFGALLLLSQSTDLSQEDRIAFATGVGGQISAALALARAFVEKDLSERRAREQASILRSVLESLADGVVVADERGRFILSNAAAEDVLRSRLVDAPPEQWPSRYGLFLPDTKTPFPAEELPLARALRGGSSDRVEMFVRHERVPEGAWLSVTARPLKEEAGGGRGGVAVLRDVTREKATQAQLMVSDRMASVGTLAAGVAHEINNPLASVVANLELAAKDLAALAPSLEGTGHLQDLLEELRDAQEGAERVRQIVRDLRIFSRAQEEKSGAVDLLPVLESSLRMAWNEIRHRALLVKDFQEVPLVEANESRLGQVFLNLIVNAAHAIPEGQANKNQIRVSTSRLPDGRVQVDIADTGSGIPPEVMKRLFTPFFTTKPVGVGTGLGLSICHRLVSAIGGEIRVESTVGRGTVFHVLLPAATEAAPAAAPAPPRLVAPRRGRVLVVDDERAVGASLRRLLAGEHAVTVLASAVEAIERIRAGERFDAILCDLMMPVVTGMDLHAQLESLAPDQAQRLIFLTGGAFTPKAREFLDRVPNPRLEKPFELQGIRALVNDLLAKG